RKTIDLVLGTPELDQYPSRGGRTKHGRANIHDQREYCRHEHRHHPECEHGGEVRGEQIIEHSAKKRHYCSQRIASLPKEPEDERNKEPSFESADRKVNNVL